MAASEITVPTTRADHYVHGNGAIVRLDTDRISVLVNHQVSGMVTLAAHGPDPVDAYGVDLDLTPQAARRLAVALAAAAEEAAGSSA